MKKFYFTNPTDDRHAAKEIQARIEEELKGIIKLVNPFYDRAGTPTTEIAALDKGVVPKVSAGEIVHNDMKLIRDCDGIVGFITNKSSWGSIQECFAAHYMFGKPTFIIFDAKSSAQNIHPCDHCGTKNPNNIKHPWVRANSTCLYTDVKSFIKDMRERYNYEDYTPKTIDVVKGK